MKLHVLVQVVLLTKLVLSNSSACQERLGIKKDVNVRSGRCGECLTYNCSTDLLTDSKNNSKTKVISASLDINFPGDQKEFAQYSLYQSGTQRQTGNLINEFNVEYEHKELDNGTPISVQFKNPLNESWNGTLFTCTIYYKVNTDSPSGKKRCNKEELLIPAEDNCTSNLQFSCTKDTSTVETPTTFGNPHSCKSSHFQEIPIHLLRSPIPIALFISSVIVAATIGGLYLLLFKYQYKCKQRDTEKRVRFASYDEIIAPEKQNRFDLMNVMKMARMKSLLENRKRPSSSTQSSSVPPPPPRGRSGTFGNLGSFAHSLWATVSSEDVASEGKQGGKN